MKNIKEITFERAKFLIDNCKHNVVAVLNNKFYTDFHLTNYPSKKNVIGLSAYSNGFGSSIFLPKETRFFEILNNDHPYLPSFFEEIKKEI